METTTKIIKKRKPRLIKILEEPTVINPEPEPGINFDTLPMIEEDKVQEEIPQIIPINLEENPANILPIETTIDELPLPLPLPLSLPLPPQVSVQTEIENTGKQEKNVNVQRQKNNNKSSFQPNNSVFEKALLTRDITINIIHIGKYIKETIETILKDEIEGKCSVEGYIKKNSVSVINYSSGIVKAENITFTTVFTCEVCFPVEGMLINCIAMSEPTKAGIRAQHSTEKPSPFVAFISRDHHYNSAYFNSIKNGDTFKARIIGQTFELNDSTISIIAELVKPARDLKQQNKPRIEF
jgi:hypothetical protein